MITFVKILLAIAFAVSLASCGVDAGARLGPYGTRAGVAVGEATPPPAQPGRLPPPLPPE